MTAIHPRTVVQQIIDQRVTSGPANAVIHWETQRNFVLSGPEQGVGTFSSLDQAVEAARTLSTGSNPGMAILKWRGGFRVHDLRADSHTYRSTTSHGPLPPITREVASSNVPFAFGNVRLGGAGNGPAYVKDDRLVGIIDGAKVLRVSEE